MVKTLTNRMPVQGATVVGIVSRHRSTPPSVTIWQSPLEESQVQGRSDVTS